MPFNKRKAFGQHFLKDASVIRAIVEATQQALAAAPGSTLLEVGPGEGAITRPLIQALPLEQPIVLAERDRELIEFWRGESRVINIFEGDFAAIDSSQIRELKKLVVVSNLPYSAGTAIVVKLAEMGDVISEMILMFQAEVAQRLYAEPSTPDRGSLSLYIQNEWDVEPVIEAPPEAFSPPPKVWSEVIRLRRRDLPRVDVSTAEKRALWNQLLKSAFQHRRKMLRGNLTAAPFQAALQKSGVDPTKRAESLIWDEWIQIWGAL
jgi:16S rRNA (adenine1518-N6/adenine1519-N6)-dimethyltransferase